MNLDNLIQDCVKQNRTAQKELYELYKKTLFVLCLKYCTNQEEAEDVLHDTFIEIFTSINKYKGTGNFEGWMKRIAINKAVTRYKKSYDLVNLKDNISIDYSLEENLIQLTLDEILHNIQQLPNQYRLVFNLYVLDDYSHKEIAKLLEITESTSKSNLHRAKLILKEKLTPNKPLKKHNK